MCLPRQPVRDEDLVAFYDELERDSRRSVEEVEHGTSPCADVASESSIFPVNEIVSKKTNPNRRKGETRPADDKENDQQNRMTGAELDRHTHKQTDDPDGDELTSSGFLVTHLSDCE